jgi:hypothetical protein
MISCWADASAAAYVPKLKAFFPGVEIQPKGLLATEGIVSLPLVGHDGGALAIRSHFFEFEDANGAGDPPRLAHELEIHGRYRVIITTGGGLYRYPLHDEVEVVGFEGQCPRIRFLGRSNATCDLVGEKLHESHVREVVERVLASLGTGASFKMLAPVAGSPPRYRLFLELDEAGVPPSGKIATALEAGLSENPHYQYAVNLGQLGTAEVQLLPRTQVSAWEVYQRRCLERGQRIGDIKPVALDTWSGWARAFSAGR